MAAFSIYRPSVFLWLSFGNAKKEIKLTKQMYYSLLMISEGGAFRDRIFSSHIKTGKEDKVSPKWLWFRSSGHKKFMIIKKLRLSTEIRDCLTMCALLDATDYDDFIILFIYHTEQTPISIFGRDWISHLY